MQTFKTIYFPDGRSGTKRGVTLSFGPDDAPLYRRVEYLSSLRIRELLGVSSARDLEERARRAGQPVSAFCRTALRASLLSAPERNFADGLQATFSGGRDQPLQNWYPYLEGYSPDFVREILATYAPRARHILDPFAGSGTTPLTVMADGGVGYYSDVNPLCTFLIAAKATIRRSAPATLLAIRDDLRHLAANLASALRANSPDPVLSAAFKAVFGESVFFDEITYQDVLRTRALIDGLDDPRLRTLSTIAALRSLVPSSRLIRRGDLRFKNERELARGGPTFQEAFASSLLLLASDLEQIGSCAGEVKCVGHSALETAYSDQFDAVVTSPPYLNGTNYFRNTKVELWFLRMLSSKDELRAFRHKAVTAGINDVTSAKTSARRGSFDSPLLDDTVSAISASAYDPRIPAMVETYFNDLYHVISRLIKSVGSGGIIAVDIGDSAYAGVHVPTDRVLSEIMVRLGGSLVDDVTLRERASRDGAKLRQCLLVFRKD